MKRYYQPKGKKNKYKLRENTYRRTWYVISDYPFFKELQQQKVSDGMMLRESEAKYLCNAQTLKYIEAIEDAQKEIPAEYVEFVMSHIVEKKKYKDMEGIPECTAKEWVQRFIWLVARNLGDI